MPIPKWLLIVLFSAALIGFADSAYLTAQHVQGVIPPCGASLSCNSVLTSKYANVGSVPVAAVGMMYYGTVLILLIAYLDSHRHDILHWISWLVSAGMLGTLYFLYVQKFVLESWCIYCLMSALMTTILLMCAVNIMRHKERL